MTRFETDGTRRIALAVRYDGTPFRGFQRLAHARTVQGELERALGAMGLTGVETVGASRTDAGAHAIAHPVVFETRRAYAPAVFARALNALLPAAIRVLEAREVAPDFHPRKSALYREYLYLVKFGSPRDPLLEGRAHQEPSTVDAGAVRGALSRLVGHRDFRSFVKKSGEVEDCVRDLMAADFALDERVGVGLFFFRANGFLYGMIRAMVGMALAVGRGEASGADVERLLREPSDASIPTPVPACGLYLYHVAYEPPLFERDGAAFPLLLAGSAANELFARAGVVVDGPGWRW